MLGYIETQGRGEADRLLASLAEQLLAEGVQIAGVVQINAERGDDLPCDMDLLVLASGQRVRISQRLGPMARGCRLDAAGLEEAVGLVEGALHKDKPQLLIINKFGKQEAEGRGFRPAIGQALTEGVRVITSVSGTNRAAFDLFAQDLAEPVQPEDLAAWCKHV